MNILIAWKDDYNLNFNRIDQQHRKLIDLLNIVYNSLTNKEKDNIVEDVISDLLDYTFIHFREEEKHFMEFNYKDGPEHIAEHEFFIDKVKWLQADHASNEPGVKEDVVVFLQKWFINHIMHSDKKYQECFIKGGLQ